MKRTVGMLWLMLGLVLPGAAFADHEVDWDEWYDGEVEVRLEVSRGEGSVFDPGEHVALEFKANEDAYHLVYGIDTDGYVHVLFPRYWEDDGWVRGGRRVKLRSQDLAWPANRWGSDGIVYVEAVASPVPFDWNALGVVARGDYCEWYVDDRRFRVTGDPFLAFNDIHQRLFPDWDRAAFTVDYTYFYVGARYDAPRYLGYDYRRVYLPAAHPRFRVSVRFGWHWAFGRHCARPVYGAYYRPGRHVVHHHYHHVDYPARRGYRPYGLHARHDERATRVKHRTRHRQRDRERDAIVVRRGDRRIKRQVTEAWRNGGEPRREVRVERKQERTVRSQRDAARVERKQERTVRSQRDAARVERKQERTVRSQRDAARVERKQERTVRSQRDAARVERKQAARVEKKRTPKRSAKRAEVSRKGPSKKAPRAISRSKVKQDPRATSSRKSAKQKRDKRDTQSKKGRP